MKPIESLKARLSNDKLLVQNEKGFLSTVGFEWNPAATDKEIAEFETVLHHQLPAEFKESLDAVPKWLHEYIVAGKYKLTTESLSIGMDVAIYLGEVFVHEFPQIYWGFFTKPKSRVSVNEPVLLGFENGLDMNPRRIVDTLMWQCANGKSSEGLYEAFEIWSKFVPAQPSKTN